MGARDLLQDLSEVGLQLSLDPSGGIRVAPRDLLTDDIRDLIRSHRAELVEVLVDQVPPSDPVMHTCTECTNLSRNGICQAAASGRLNGVWRRYSPVRDIPVNCECFTPKPVIH